jgi:hypothetical protein
MNGRRVLTRTNGEFEERMLLAEGSNTFIFEAVDSFGATTRTEVVVVHSPKTETEVETARIMPLEEVLHF